MGPGVVNSANTAIGRALRLCLINIGYCKAGAGDPNFIGLPTKFGMCIAEDEETSPWQPYHMDKGVHAGRKRRHGGHRDRPHGHHRFPFQNAQRHAA